MNKKTPQKVNYETLKTATFKVLPHVSHFLTSILANNYSRKTHDAYKRDLLTFDKFMTAEMPHLTFQEIDKHTIELFKAHLNSDERLTSLSTKIHKQEAVQKYAYH